MGLPDLLVAFLYKLFRALEWISIHISRTGTFLNTDPKLTSATDAFYSRQARCLWLHSLHYPSGFKGFLYAISGAMFVVQGYSLMWVAYAYDWWLESDVFDDIRMQILYLSPTPLDPTLHASLLLLAKRSLVLSSLLASLTIAFILAPRVLNWRQRRVSRREAAWVGGVGVSWLSTLVLQHFNTVMNEEIVYVIMPVSLGVWFWIAAAWGYVERRMERRGEGEMSAKDKFFDLEERID